MYFLNLLKNIRLEYKLYKLNERFHKSNENTLIELKEFVDINRINSGAYSYGKITVLAHGSDSKLRIGSYCSIGPECIFVLASDHALSRVSTYPFKANVLKKGQSEAMSKGDIIVEDDVWIGCRAIIMSGVTIGKGAVVAAGSVVTKDVEAYSIVAGVPAKMIKKRFSEDVIEKIYDLDFSKLTKHSINKHINELYYDISNESNLQWIEELRNEVEL